MTQSPDAPPALNRCATCDQPVTGRFCRHCGAASSQVDGCARCGQPLPANSRYCAGCGLAVGQPPDARSGERLRWFVAGGLVVAVAGGLVLGLARREPVPSATGEPTAGATFAGGAAAGEAPDISSLSPRERFDRLFNRVMRAAESGDEATVTSFAPMAMGAYRMLDSADADARYHAALIALHTGDVAGAAALADTILATAPGHLFGYIVRGTIARFQKDDRVLQQTYAEFLAHYDAELARGRPEYQDHPKSLEEFHAAATTGRSPKS